MIVTVEGFCRQGRVVGFVVLTATLEVDVERIADKTEIRFTEEMRDLHKIPVRTEIIKKISVSMTLDLQLNGV